MISKLRNLSIKTTVIVAVIMMGTVSLVLTFVTSSVFSHLVENDKNQLLNSIVDREFHNISKSLALDLQDISTTIGESVKFKRIFQDHKKLENLLSRQFGRYFAQDGLVDMVSIAVYDNQYKLKAKYARDTYDIACKDLIQKMLTSEIPKRQTSVCRQEDHIVFSSLVAIGGLKPDAYVQIESNLSRVLSQLEENIQFPIVVQAIDSDIVIYESELKNNVQNAQPVEHIVYYDKHKIAKLSLIVDVYELNKELNRKIFYIILGTIAITILAISMVIYVLGHNLVGPMRHLANQIQKVKRNKKCLGEQIQVRGNREIQELAQDFNAMTSELDNLYSSLQLMALTDPLTRLPNRLYLHDRLRDLIRVSKENSFQFALCILDLDKFKQINDTFGHSAGDEFLQVFADRLKSSIAMEMYCLETNSNIKTRTGDVFAARLGGDEFALLLPLIPNRQSIISLMTQFLAHVSEPIISEGEKFSLVPSIGVAIYPEDGEDYSRLFRCADRAMYLAKKSGLGVAGSHNRGQDLEVG